MNLFEEIKKGNIEFCKEYIRSKKTLDPNDLDDSPLMVAILSKNWEIVSVILKGEIDLNWKNRHGETALMFAARYKNLDLVKYLINNGVDYKVESKYKGSVLFYALESNNLEIINYLLNLDLDINAKNRYNKTVLSEAIKRQNISMIKMFLNHNANIMVSDLITTIIFGNKEILITLIENGADENSLDKTGDSLLMIAALEKQWDLVRLLYKLGAVAKSINKTSLGWQILNDAAITKNIDLVKKIVRDLNNQ